MSAGDVAPDESPGRAADELSRLEGSIVNGDTRASAAQTDRRIHGVVTMVSACFCRAKEANGDRAQVVKNLRSRLCLSLNDEWKWECRACQCYDAAPRYRRMRCPSDEDLGQVGSRWVW